jgi:hypothetical protein
MHHLYFMVHYAPYFIHSIKANITAACLENQFRAYDLCCEYDHRHVEARVEALLASVDEDILINFRPCDISKEIQSLNLERPAGFNSSPI